MTNDEARHFAMEWANYWNSGDIDKIMSHYAQDIEMYSPLIKELMGIESGAITGWENLKKYFLAGLDKYPDNKFQIKSVFRSVDSISILFTGATGDLVSETLFLTKDFKIQKMIAHYPVDHKR